MLRRIPRDQAILASLLTLFACRAVVGSAVVPPWQGPDEPVHFVLVQMLADDTPNSMRPKLEAQVLESMGRYRWWEPYDGRTPDPLPRTFGEAAARLGIGTYSQPLYYRVAASVLRVGRPTSLEAAYWRLRALSITFALLTLAMAWAGTRLLFGSAVAAGATAIAALHPQFLLTSMSVSPDALLIVLGSVMWWHVGRVIERGSARISLTVVVVAAIAALLTKRTAAPLSVVAVGIALASMIVPQTVRIPRRMVLRALGALGVCAILLVGTLILVKGPIGHLVTVWHSALNLRRPLDEITLPQALEYSRISIDYVWLVAGWLRFPASEPWLWVARVLTIAGLTGAAVLIVRSPLLRRPLSIAWLFVVVQAVTVIGWGFFTHNSSQGRYLFPVIAPATALLWLGLTHVTPARARPYAGPALIAILAVMDVTGVTTVLMPAYLPWD